MWAKCRFHIPQLNFLAPKVEPVAKQLLRLLQFSFLPEGRAKHVATIISEIKNVGCFKIITVLFLYFWRSL